jgi:uncharacterized pyridoxamine 5'-phosphate oxidase family protein
MSKKSVIYEYLKENKYMALATASKAGKPEVATVEYVLDGDELLINTYTYYRKYQNLLGNPQVACVITANHDQTLQFEGGIRQLEGKEAEDAKQKMLVAEPDFADFFNDNDTRFFRISPTWMRLRDYTKEPMETTEYTPA